MHASATPNDSSSTTGNGVHREDQAEIENLKAQLAKMQREKNNLESETRILQQQLLTNATQESLREHILSAASDAITTALNDSIVTQAESALKSAASSGALVAEMKEVLERSKEMNANRIAELQLGLAAEGKVVQKLKEKLAFVENTLAIKEREMKVLVKEGKATMEMERNKMEATKDIKEIRTVAQAESCLASLLLYPDLVSRSADEKGANVSPFFVALLEYCQEVSTFLFDTRAPASSAARPVAAYAELWRAACTKGRRGWRGEIIHAALTSADRAMVENVAVHPDSRNALRNDLRALQRLYNTGTETVRDWLMMGLGANAEKDAATDLVPPLIPLHSSNLGAESVSSGANGIHQQNGVQSAKSQLVDAEEMQLTKMLEDAKDWGEESVVLAVVDYLIGGPSRKRSIADDYYGLKWDSRTRQLVGILSVDEVNEMPSYSFVGVEHIRDRLMRNVEFLLGGLKAQNCLLYGPPGCGKSSMVLSFLKSHGASGLRLVEIGKEDMVQLPEIIDTISRQKQKFVLFIDDLTFEEYESEAMRAGKAALEGSLRVSSKNTAVFVTSNRRYPVGSHLTDGTLEKLAFSHRFGIVLSFPATTRSSYLKIVKHLANQAGIVMDPQRLDAAAIQWALGNDGNSHGISGRTARQFIDFVHSEQRLRGTDDPLADYMISSGNKNAGAVPANLDWQLN